MDIDALAKGIGLFGSAVTTAKQLVDLLPDGSKKDEAAATLERAEREFKIAEAEAARKLNYEICHDHFPPEIMLSKDDMSGNVPNVETRKTLACLCSYISTLDFALSYDQRHGSKHAHADHVTYAAFWHRRLAQLDGAFSSRVGLGVSACYGICGHREDIMTKPSVFIGSSSEGLEFARAARSLLAQMRK